VARELTCFSRETIVANAGYESPCLDWLRALIFEQPMKRIALLLVLFAGLAATTAARSQQPTPKASSTGKQSLQRDDSVKLKPSPELQKSLDDLAAAVQALALRLASDPELKLAAMKVASGFVSTAQQVVTEQSAVLQDALKTAADRIAAAQPPQHDRTKKP
jgi:hypothetical protein